MSEPFYIGNYEVMPPPIGSGGMGLVYRARHISLDVPRAVKILNPSANNIPEQRKRFKREAMIQVRLEHPNIVQVYDFLEEDNKFYIVMELVEGGSLSELLHRDSSAAYSTATGSGIERQQTSYALPIEYIISIACQCLDALGYAHKRSIIHRDIKPNNILLVNRGDFHQAKMTDFGIAKIMSEGESANDYALTRAGIGIGTPEYMAPEQIDPQRFGGIDHRADLYSLGLVIFEMISGVNPFGSRTTSEFQILEQKVKGEIPSIKSHCSCVDSRLEKILTKVLDPEPSARFHNASEFKQSLSELKSSDSVYFADARTRAIHVWDRQNKKRFHHVPLFSSFVKSRILPKSTPGTVLNSFGTRNILYRLKVILAFCASILFKWGQNRLLLYLVILGLFLVSVIIGLWYFGSGRQKAPLPPSIVESPQDKDPFTAADKWSEKGRREETSVSRSGRSNDPFVVNRTASPAKALEDNFWENPINNLSNSGREGGKSISPPISERDPKKWSPRTGGDKKPPLVIDRGSVLRQRNN